MCVFVSFFTIVFSTCYHWWICFLVWLLSSFFLFIFHYFLKNFFLIIFYFNNFILFYFIFFFLFLSFLPFILSRVDDRLLVLQPGIRAVPEVGEPSSGHWSTKDHAAPCNIKWWKSPRDLHLNAKTQRHSMTSKLQCWTPYAKQLARQEHNPIH